ncbi:MAG: V-type ATP synthase subunit E family protein [Synergistaceae bacterium]|nr:V-type ATP synthase subunit E family protein [Synergistaceae bacterium]
MNDINKNLDSSIEATKLRELCNLVLHRADVEHDRIIDDVRNEINDWSNEQQAILDAECDAISRDANRRADEIANRLITNAKRECSRERIKLHNEYVDDAYAIFQDKLEALHKRSDYIEILAGLAFEAIEKIPQGMDMLLRLSEADAEYGGELAGIIRDAIPVNITFDSVPGRFKGGVMILSADGRWSVTSDWQSKTEESKDEITARVLAAL